MGMSKVHNIFIAELSYVFKKVKTKAQNHKNYLNVTIPHDSIPKIPKPLESIWIATSFISASDITSAISKGTLF